jgi:Flp pilus assembly protein TadD
MRTGNENRMLSCAHREAIAIAGALLLAACATTAPERPVPATVQDETGFTITEDVRVASDVRSDYETAMRHLAEERYEQGIALLVTVTESAPQVTSAHIDLGIAYSRIDDLQKAEATLKRALELNPNHPVAHNELGMVYRRLGRFQEARESYALALALHPEFHFARRNLAILCDLYLADTDCALENYTLYTQAVPDDEEASMWIADIRNRAGQ